jgi:hypothetical protein
VVQPGHPVSGVEPPDTWPDGCDPPRQVPAEVGTEGLVDPAERVVHARGGLQVDRVDRGCLNGNQDLSGAGCWLLGGNLERDGLLSRTVTATVPIPVHDALADLGVSILEPALALKRWSEDHMDAVMSVRAAYDAAQAVGADAAAS